MEKKVEENTYIIIAIIIIFLLFLVFKKDKSSNFIGCNNAPNSTLTLLGKKYTCRSGTAKLVNGQIRCLVPGNPAAVECK